MQHALAVFLIVIVPIWDAWYTRRLRRSTDPNMKARVYLVTMGWVWVASALVWWMDRPGFFFPLVILKPKWLPQQDALGGLLAGMCVGFTIALLMPVILAWRSEKARRSLRRALENLSFFLPVTAKERWLFAAVSITAGICEETLYRGFLIRYFSGQWHLALVASVILSSCVFGIAHGYQGVKGIVLTAILGGVFAVLYVVTGGLLWPMILHALVDLRILMFPPAVMVPEAGAAAAQ
ncbi:CPBP family intramembrane glutamic endopeptidase [Paracidobacterium acidisoli]|uniref:CPBP family intramembrane metalloprotease n=1 Tax=Paracidobacterium acidisoli TaxID=2303751 RepID=A0A372IPR3_9BACT|nr:type II CAAX endopeptidase family protein [Paracidobacterium acidisoli]MBT9331189.1 CPBP family intramembrane metalloprotease [Paracidobacterium acidisoli]